MARGVNTKWFGDKKYTVNSYHKRKRDAKRRAADLRKSGYLARVIKSRKKPQAGYLVYQRVKQYKKPLWTR